MKYTGNELCDICIDIMQWWSDNTTLTYGEINYKILRFRSTAKIPR